MTWLHLRWHWAWAVIWSTVGWNTRAAQHIDRWMVLGLDDLSLHVLHPNEDRVGCRMVPFQVNAGEVV